MMQARYLDDQKRVAISCTFGENKYLAAFPRKRFVSRDGHWVAPLLMDTARALLDLETQGVLQLDADLRARVDGVFERRIIRRIAFPEWYIMKTRPYDHQRAALDHIWGLPRAALFMEQGTGKSKVAIDLNCARMMDGQIDRWVVFCPNSVRDTWLHELHTHWPMSGVEFHILRGKKARVSGHAVLVVGYESIQQCVRGGKVYDELLTHIAGHKYSVTADESHWVKGHDANRSRTVEFISRAAVSSQIMTGTEVSNGVMDLYQQFQILDPEIVGSGSFFSFRARYAIMGGYESRQIIGYQNTQELMDKIQPYVFQCRKADCLDLPEKIYTTRHVQMADEQARIYKQVDRDMQAMVDAAMNDGKSAAVVVETTLAKYGALQQVTGGFVNYDERVEEFKKPARMSAWVIPAAKNPKVREVLRVIEEDPARKTIIWAKYRREIEAITQELRREYGPNSVVEYHGGIGLPERAENLDAFKTGPARYFVANQFTGGTGLTINEATRVIYYSNTLRLVDRLQSEDRCHRIGQAHSVLYIDLVCADTVDEDIIGALTAKLDMAEYVKAAMRA